MRVLVTGATGFVASKLILVLVNLGHEVYASTREPSVVTVPGVKVLSSINEAHFVKRVKPNIVFHLAASRNRVGLADDFSGVSSDIEKDWNLIKACVRLDTLEAFYYFGTADIFSTSEIEITTSSPRVPRNAYGLRKLASINLINGLWESYGFPAVTLIPSIIYGPGQKNDMFLSSLISALINQERFDMSSGSQLRDFVYVEDLIDFLAALITKDVTSSLGESFLLGGGNAISILDLAKATEQIIGVKNLNLLNIGGVETRIGDSKGYYFDTSRSKEELGWCPEHTLQDGLAETIKEAKKVTAYA